MKNRIRLAAIAGLSTISLTLTACAGDGAESTSTGTSAESSQAAESTGESTGGLEINAAGDYNPLERDQIQDGGELTMAITEMAEQQNVFHANMNLYTRNVWDKYNPQLTLFDGDGTYHPNPAYLSEVKDEVVDGKTVVTYTIVDEAKYNDDTPIDWTSFENTWKFNNGSNPDVQVNSTDG